MRFGVLFHMTHTPPPGTQTAILDCHWLPVKDGDERATALYRRHYSSKDYADGRLRDWSNGQRWLVCGPGEKMLLMTAMCDALFVWRKFIDDSGQTGVNCAVFRNESDVLSSALILEAEQHAWRRWPRERLYTYVNKDAIVSSNPGYCFQMAGWQRCGKTKLGLIVLEKVP